MSTPIKEMIFVYNADSDLFSQITDFAHKIIAPDSYQCALCKLTYGNFAIKTRWRDFLKDLPLAKSFFHRDDFLRRFPQQKDLALPAILLSSNNDLRVLMNAEELKNFPDLDELIASLQKKAANIS